MRSIVLLCIVCLGFASNTTPKAIKWEIQVNSTSANFQTVTMCKGTTTGFAGSNGNGIYRTQDGVKWVQVAQFTAAYFYGFYCFPGAKRVIAVGFSDGDPNFPNNAMFVWSEDGGDTWGTRQHITGDAWLQSVTFHNSTHGVVLPMYHIYGGSGYYYTTTGGLTAQDWKLLPADESLEWVQTHAIWNFGGRVIRSLAETTLCTSNDFGATWDCGESSINPAAVSFTSESDGLALGGSIWSTTNGGNNWTEVGKIPPPLLQELYHPEDMLWIPGSKAVFLVGGHNLDITQGAALQSLDGGITWEQILPHITFTMFTSVDYTISSASNAEVYITGLANSGNSYILHATIPL